MAASSPYVITRFSAAEPSYPYDESKFYELVLYIAGAFRDDLTFGRIKLAKLIFNSDVRAMRKLGHPISGVTYIKDTWGHNPKQLLLAELDLSAEGDAEIIIGDGKEEPRFIRDDDRRRLVPHRSANLALIPDSEKVLVDAVIEQYRLTPAIAMSDESHQTLGWQVTEWKKPIPLETLSVRRPTVRELEHGSEIARHLDLSAE
jgi:hypothetical protein